jgi:hypothetical protein
MNHSHTFGAQKYAKRFWPFCRKFFLSRGRGSERKTAVNQALDKALKGHGNLIAAISAKGQKAA